MVLRPPRATRTDPLFPYTTLFRSDAVELPSQFMENWCYDPATLKNFAKHWQTGAAMPEELLTKLRTSRRFHAGLATVRQLEFALFDLRLHRDFEDRKSVV